jgi:tRNA-dihydrouridine synthase B
MEETLLQYLRKKPLGLSPMSGICDGPFRRICRTGDAGLLVAPMVAARHLVHKPTELPQEQHFAESEHPIGIQIIASGPREAQKAGIILSNTQFDFIELNAGCPSRRILAMGCGAALLQKPELIREIMLAIKEGAPEKPLTLKIRLGFRCGNFAAANLVRLLDGVPLVWVTVHGRYGDQSFTHPADWDAIKQVVDSSPFPITGNGGITNPDDAKRMMAYSGTIAVMIGRGALGRPWVFGNDEKPEWDIRSRLMHRHWQMQMDEYPPNDAVIKFRKHLIWYSRGHRDACEIRRLVPLIKEPAQVENLLQQLDLI